MTQITTTTGLLDVKGKSIAQVRRELGEDIYDWPDAERKVLTGKARWDLFQGFHDAFKFCFLCERRTDHDWDSILEAHHFLGPNRSDERECLVMACRRCHRERVTRADLPHWLFAKWKHDPKFTDWRRCALVAGHHLPNLEPSC